MRKNKERKADPVKVTWFPIGPIPASRRSTVFFHEASAKQVDRAASRFLSEGAKRLGFARRRGRQAQAERLLFHGSLLREIARVLRAADLKSAGELTFQQFDDARKKAAQTGYGHALQTAGLIGEAEEEAA